MSPSLQNTIQRDVYQIIRRLESSFDRLSSLTVYEHIKRSNSSLARQKKKILEDAIDRALTVRQQERVQDQEEEDSEAAMEAEERRLAPRNQDTSLLNKQIAKAWNIPRAKMPNRMDGDSDPLAARSSTRRARGHTSGKDVDTEPKQKRRKVEKAQDVDRSPPTDISLADFAGIEDVILQLSKPIKKYFYLRDQYAPRGVLLHGPSGCGKTDLVRAVAAELEVSFMHVEAPSVVAGMSGDSEKNIRGAFEEAKRIAPCLLFFDDIDVITGKKDTSQREMEKRMIAQMGACLDDLVRSSQDTTVFFFAATKRPDQIDESLRRAGRFDKEISLGMPNQAAREEILRVFCKELRLGANVDFSLLAKNTPGFVGADLKAVIHEAREISEERVMDEIERACKEAYPEDTDEPQDLPQTSRDIRLSKRNWIEKRVPLNDRDKGTGFRGLIMDDLLQGIANVQPMAKREGFSAVPSTTWDEVGGMEDVRKSLQEKIVGPIANPEWYAIWGKSRPAGVLLWGPPGCGKTLVARAVANEARANFIAIKGPELLNKYVGESERSVRQLFTRARESRPCILFFDEVDSLVSQRDAGGNESSHRVVNAMLAELDGLEGREGVFVIAATNRPDQVDPAILRPGRLGTLVFVDVPTASGRADILTKIIKARLKDKATKRILDDAGSIAQSERTEGFSGADLDYLYDEATNRAMARSNRAAKGLSISPEDWEDALGVVSPSIDDANYFRVTMKAALRRLNA